MEDLLQVIKDRQRKEHLRQVDLAKIIGVSQAMVSDVLSGKKPVTIGKMAQGLLRWDASLLPYFLSADFDAANGDSEEQSEQGN